MNITADRPSGWANHFHNKIMPEPNSGCWLWTGALNNKGYGVFHINGKMRLAHRVAWEVDNGSVPAGLEIDHLCRTRSCVNPQHMEAVTHHENVLRGGNAHKQFCKRGHPLSGHNLNLGTDGSRQCRACAHIRYTRLTAAQIARRRTVSLKYYYANKTR